MIAWVVCVRAPGVSIPQPCLKLNRPASDIHRSTLSAQPILPAHPQRLHEILPVALSQQHSPRLFELLEI